MAQWMRAVGSAPVALAIASLDRAAHRRGDSLGNVAPQVGQQELIRGWSSASAAVLPVARAVMPHMQNRARHALHRADRRHWSFTGNKGERAIHFFLRRAPRLP